MKIRIRDLIRSKGEDKDVARRPPKAPRELVVVLDRRTRWNSTYEVADLALALEEPPCRDAGLCGGFDAICVCRVISTCPELWQEAPDEQEWKDPEATMQFL